MAGVWNINGVYDANTKKLTSRLSFDIGEMFLARILSMDPKNSEILLKLLDGWQFQATLEKPLQDMPQGMLRFQVVGLEDGKLKIAVVPQKDENTGTKDSIKSIEENLGLSDKPELHDMLMKMVKHNIPLTKDNIGMVKTLIDIRDKMSKGPEDEKAFIETYIQGKGIEPGSKAASDIRENLKSFFSSIKNMDTDSILTFVDNGIELTKDNIESFKRLFSNESAIYKDIKEIASSLKDLTRGTLEQTSKNNKADTGKENNMLQAKGSSVSSMQSEVLKDAGDSKNLYKLLTSTGDLKDIKIDNGNTQVAAQGIEQAKVMDPEGEKKNPKVENPGSNLKPEIEKTNLQKKETEVNTEKGKLKVEVQAEASPKLVDEKPEDTWPKVKNEFSAKTEELKSMIKDIMNTKDSIKPEVLNRVFEAVKENINDFKVFNSLSNQFYYMDVPVRINDYEYGCRLLIKDERKKDKKIDSNNVKIAASVKTINMGTVNAFVKVSGLNMKVDIKCDENWIGFINAGKDKLSKELSSMGYNTSINVEKKEEELDISGCSSFFNEDGTGTIDIRV